MVLIDTSIWVDHFRKTEPRLVELLNAERVVVHPFVMGELALGHLKSRAQILSLLKTLPAAKTVFDGEIMFFIEKNHLFGKGIGLIDAHLLASAKISHATLWTADNALAKEAKKLGVSYPRHL
jgi:predicted nucleic acid-binding protein